MAFIINKINNNKLLAPTILEKPATSGVSFKVGDALKITSNKVAKCGATDVPKYIAAAEKTAGANDVLPVYEVIDGLELETQLYGSGALTVGAKVTLHTDAAQVTATTTSGVAEIVSFAGTGSGDKVIVKF